MGFVQALQAITQRHNSMLCVGLDPDPGRFPEPWQNDPSHIYDFCAAIVDATKDLVCAFKPQIAYFAAHRAEDQLEQLIHHIHRVAPDVPVILDAKRGDIGSTAAQYAIEAFERYQADAVTLSPYMGFDSIEPYMAYPDKGLILLCRTSNAGGSDLQAQSLSNHQGASTELLYEYVARLAAGPWNRHGQLGLVVGATFPEELSRIRAIAPHLPLLVPGVGAQGGDADAVVRAAFTATTPAPHQGSLMVNSSRAILYASSGPNFAQAARSVAQTTQFQLSQSLAALSPA